MASKENQPDFNTALEKLKICLKGKNLDGKYLEVKEFLDHLDQAAAEKNADLVQTACNNFLREDRLKRINGISGTAIEELKKEVNNFVEKIGKSSQGEKLNIPVQSATVGPHKTTVSHSHPKPDHRDTQGPSPKAPRKDNFVREAKENKNNDAAPKEEPIGLPNENAEKGQIDWKHKANCLEKTLEDKTKIIAKFEKEAEKMYQENLSLEQVNQNIVKDQEKLKQKNDDLQTELQTKTEEWNLCLEQYEETCKAIEHYKKKVTHLEDSIKSINRQNEERVQKLVAERDDLRNRYSKVAGQKLKDNNSDISDLSDPFRPMKLGEKFSELYDNEWTDAFSSLTDKMKKNEKDAIKFLLDTLEECYNFCKEVADSQFMQLRDVFLYHGQDVKKTVAPTDKPRLHSKQETSLLEVRKAIASTKPESVIKVVSLLKYDDVETGMKVDPSPGYPVVCITLFRQAKMNVSGRREDTMAKSSDDADSRVIPNTDEIQKLYKRIAQLEVHNEAMLETIIELKKTDSENQKLIDKLKKECKDNLIIMDKCKREKETLEKELSDWKQKANRLSKDIEDKTAIIVGFKLNGEGMHQDNMTLRQVNNNLVKDQDELKQTNNDLRAELLAKADEWNAFLEQYEEACKALDQYKKKVTHLEDTIKYNDRQNEERVKKLVEERDDLRNRMENIKVEKEKAEKERSDLKQETKELMKNLEDKRNIIAKFEMKPALMVQEHLNLEQVNSNLVKDIEKVEQRNDDLRAELIHKTDKWNDSIKKCAEASKERDQYKKKVTHLEDTIKSINRQNEERVQKLIAERDELSTRLTKISKKKR